MESRGLPNGSQQASNRSVATFTKPAPVLRDWSFSQTMERRRNSRREPRGEALGGPQSKKNGPRRSRFYSASNRLRLLGRLLLLSRRFQASRSRRSLLLRLRSGRNARALIARELYAPCGRQDRYLPGSDDPRSRFPSARANRRACP